MAVVLGAIALAACSDPEQPPPAPKPPPMWGLECTQAIWSGSLFPSQPHGITVLAGRPEAVQIFGTPGTAPWGLTCVGDYVRTGCHMGADTRFGPPYAPAPYASGYPSAEGWDLRTDGTPNGNGCYTTRTDLITRAYIAVSCCRVVPR
ncbi:MAG: hypothetical protein AB7O45_15420 [Alphaproteobacteria bacterium]